MSFFYPPKRTALKIPMRVIGNPERAIHNHITRSRMHPISFDERVAAAYRARMESYK